MKRTLFATVFAAALGLTPSMMAGVIPYPASGTVAPPVPVFAATSGGINIYFAGSGARFSDSVEVYDTVTGYNSGAILPNMGTAVGTEVSVGTGAGQINMGDQLVFYIVSPENPSGGAGTTLYASLPNYSADGVNHAYITTYDGTGLGNGIPAGLYVGLEDEPQGHSDFNYDDDTFVFTNVAAPSVAATPEPSSLVLLGTGVLSFGGLVRRRITSR